MKSIKKNKLFKSLKKLPKVQLFILLLVLVLLPIVFFVSRQRQEIRQRAAYGNDCRYVYNYNGYYGTCVSNNQTCAFEFGLADCPVGQKCSLQPCSAPSPRPSARPSARPSPAACVNMPNNTLCTQNGASGYCMNGVCQQAKTNNQNCTHNNQCSSGNCINTTESDFKVCKPQGVTSFAVNDGERCGKNLTSSPEVWRWCKQYFSCTVSGVLTVPRCRPDNITTACAGLPEFSECLIEGNKGFCANQVCERSRTLLSHCSHNNMCNSGNCINAFTASVKQCVSQGATSSKVNSVGDSCGLITLSNPKRYLYCRLGLDCHAKIGSFLTGNECE